MCLKGNELKYNIILFGIYLVVEKIRGRYFEERGILYRLEKRVGIIFLGDFIIVLGFIYFFIIVLVRRFFWRRCWVSSSDLLVLILF